MTYNLNQKKERKTKGKKKDDLKLNIKCTV